MTKKQKNKKEEEEERKDACERHESDTIKLREAKVIWTGRKISASRFFSL